MVSQPLPRSKGGPRDPATSSRTAAEAAIRQDFDYGKCKRGKGRQEHFAKTARMTTAALDENLDSQVDQACAIAALQDELDSWDEEMDDAERSEREAIRKPHKSTSTSGRASCPAPYWEGVVPSPLHGRCGNTWCGSASIV